MASLAPAAQPHAAASSPQSPVAEQHNVSVARDEVVEVCSAEGASTIASVPFRESSGKTKALALIEKRFAEHEGKSMEELVAMMNSRSALVEARIKEEVDVAGEQFAPVQEAWCDLEEKKVRVTEAISEELLAAALACRVCRGEGKKLAKILGEAREQMLEAQNKLAMIRVVQESHAAIEKAKQAHAAALQDLQEAKKRIEEHRLQEKRILEEAQRSIASSRTGGKRKAGMSAEGEVAEGEGQIEDDLGARAVKHAKHSEVREGKDGDAHLDAQVAKIEK